MMRTKTVARTLVCAIFLGTLLASCSKSGDDLMDLSTLAPSVTTATSPVFEAKVQEEPPTYFYPFAQKRDPFIPLDGNVQFTTTAGGFSLGGEKGAGVTNLELKGILRDRRGKIALIASTDGEPYTLRSGRIYDKKNRMISGVSGIIKSRSVVLVTQDRTIRELPLYRREEKTP